MSASGSFSRLAPFAQRSQEIWQQLRQESNVELDGMRLDGSSTRRRLAFPATVDGTATQAMAVMSEGELQAIIRSLQPAGARQPS